MPSASHSPSSSARVPNQCSPVATVEVERRAVLGDERLNSSWTWLDLLALFPVDLGVLAEHREAALALAALDQLEVDAVRLEEAVEVRAAAASTPIEPRMANGAATMRFAVQAIM